MAEHPRIHFLDYAEPALPSIAKAIIAQCETLPDLSGSQILVREPNIAPYLRHELLNAAAKRDHHALLGVQITTLENWLQGFIPTELNICSEQTRLLILVESLLSVPDLLGQANPWNLAESLLTLFDELTLNRMTIDADLPAFAQQLARLYQIPDRPPAGLQQEAQLIHQLWHAWHEQLHAQQLTDPVTAQTIAMQASLNQLPTYQQLHLIGIEPVYKAQQDWLQQIFKQPSVHLWLQGIPGTDHPEALHNSYLSQLVARLGVTGLASTPKDAYHNLLSNIFNIEEPLLTRLSKQKQQSPTSPLQNKLRIFSARNAEQEAAAIDVQIRQWLLEGKRAIAVVTENRLQARRLRALLERADIQLQDTAGWALSTTRAAATLESLLICIEEDFPKDALLDLLKSPLCLPTEDRERRKNIIYRMEHDIIQNEGIASGLDKYLRAIQSRAQRLQELWTVSPSELISLLEQLDEATRGLRAIARQKNELSTYLEYLYTTLQQLGMHASLGDDAAGYQILQLIQDMIDAAKLQSFRATWFGLRAWLGRNLEQHYFRPAHTGSPVQLLNLAQTECQHFDGIIIASMEQDSLPGSMPAMPFFNSAVRQQLALPDSALFRASRLRHFFRLLFSSPAILLSHRHEQDAEVIIPSPWLDAIRSFHQLAYADDLQDHTLQQLVQSPKSEVFRCDTYDLPTAQTQPRPTVDAQTLTDTYSASSYQQLIDCPYQFFAAQYLKLSPPEEVKELLSKREYGERIHQCLQAFHADVEYLPGPFTQPVNDLNRPQAIQLLNEIAQRVFEFDLEDNYLHRGWYHRWLAVIPDYIDWQINEDKQARVQLTEQKLERELNPQLHIKGRIDRIDQNRAEQTQHTVIDYKTGSLPSKKEIDAAEKIQLPFYALLTDESPAASQQVFYLNLGKAGEVQSKFTLAEDNLSQLKTDIGQRLIELVNNMRQGQALPAWENKDVCQYCSMTTLCRVGTWQ